MDRLCRNNRRISSYRTFLAAALFAFSFVLPDARGDYVEHYKTWKATTQDTWEVADLSGSPFNVPAGAVAEIAVFNTRPSSEAEGGVREVGSTLARSFVLHEAQSGGADVVVMHVQADANSQIEHYSSDTRYITFALLGYWTSGTYVENFESFSPSAVESWQSLKLNGYGVGAGQVAEIVLANSNPDLPRLAGVRADGSTDQRLIELHEAEDGGVDCATMFVAADATANASIAVYAESDTDVTFNLVGYWTDPPGAYVQTFTAIGSPSESGTWEDRDVSTYGVPANVVAEFTLANGDPSAEAQMGVRRNGSAISTRLLDLHEAEPSGQDLGRAHVKVDADGVIEFYHEDLRRTPFAFYATGYWVTPAVSVTETEDSTTVFEQGTTDYYTVALSTLPVANVVITVDPDDQVDVGAGAGMPVDLTFTTTNWSVPQSVTITAVDDAVVEGDHTATITHTAVSADAEYDAIPIVDVIANIVDNDAPGVRITETNGSTVVTERGASDTYTIVLDAPPVDTVIVTVDPDSQTDLGAGADATIALTFTTSNWSSPRTVTVTAVDDGVAEGTHSSTITHSAASSDAAYDGLTIDALTATVLEFAGAWKMDDGSGAVAADCSVTGNDGALQPDALNGPQWVTSGKLCAALSFDGIDDYVVIPADPILDMTGDATIAGWFMLDADFDSASGTSQILFEKYADDSQNLHIALVGADYGKAVPGGSLVFKIEEHGTYRYTWSSRTSWTAGVWYHFAATLDTQNNANNRVFINGVNDTAGDLASGSQADMSFSAPVHIGGFQADTDDLAVASYFAGLLDEIRLFGGVLDDSAVEDLAYESEYTITDLGTPTGGTSLALSVNDDIQITGYAENAFDSTHNAWLLQDSDFTALGTLGGPAAESRDINDSGAIVGWAQTASSAMHAFLWDALEGMTDLGTLPGDAVSEAFAVNSNDEVVGASLISGSPATNRRAFLYLPASAYDLPTGMNNLGTLGGAESVGTDINDSGQVVGGAQNSAFTMHPFLWLPSPAYGLPAGMNDLGTLGGESQVVIHRAQGINESGEVVGLSFTAARTPHAFVWLPSAAHGLTAGMNDLGTLPGGSISWAFGINDDGVVVGTSNYSGGTFRAFVAVGGEMIDLHDKIDPRSAWELSRATGINNDGAIVGFGISPSGQQRPFLATPTVCGCGGASASGSMAMSAGYGTTDAAGLFETTAANDQGETLAAITASNTDAGILFTYTISPDTTIVSGNFGLDLVYTGPALPRMLSVGTSAPSGGFTATISMILTATEPLDPALDPIDLELLVLDPEAASAAERWIPAGVNIGESEPTETIGESGYMIRADGSVEYWANRDATGVFAIGTSGMVPQEPTISGTGSVTDGGDDATGPPCDLAHLCGIGALQAGLIGLSLLATQRVRRRRHRPIHR